jgi:hypothetical protein
MSTHAKSAPFEPATVSVRAKIAALWTAMLFVFAYVDLFSLYRDDVRADIAAGRISGFAIDQSFLLATTAYIVLPALMVFLTLALPARGARMTNLVLAVGYALTIVGSTVGEGNYYYLFGSAVEVVLLVGIAVHAWTWPRVVVSSVPAPAADRRQHTTA